MRQQELAEWKANIHPGCFVAPVAHLDRVTDFESVGSPFESGRTQSDSLELVPAENAYTDKAHGYFRMGNMNIIQAAFYKNLFV